MKVNSASAGKYQRAISDPEEQFIPDSSERVSVSDFHDKNLEDEEDGLVQRQSIISFEEESKSFNDRGAIFDKSNKLSTYNKEQTFLQKHQNLTNDELLTKLNDLRLAIADLYLGIKQKTKDDSETPCIEDENEEKDIIMSLDSYVLIEYIKSSVDIILNLKFEEIEKRLMDKNDSKPQETGRSSIMSTSGEGPPKVYEELIQSLEGDVRKHIRIEQQLKLHIESMENRIEELENQTEKIEGENEAMKKSIVKRREKDSKVREIEEACKGKEEIIRTLEGNIKLLKENEIKMKREIESLKKQIIDQTASIDPFQIINQAIDNASRTQDPNSLNKTQPMIIKQSGVSTIGESLNINQLRKISSQFNHNNPDFGSYSSNQSFADGGGQSPNRRTPDINHPYLHHTQIVSKKKTATPGTTSSKTKKFMPNSLTEGSSIQPSFNSAISTYNTGKVIGTRKLSSQQSRNGGGSNIPQPISKTVTKGISKNSWIAQMHQNTISQQPQPQFSNIINNNIQGLSINYSNQIIADPIQQFANNFMAIPSNNMPQSQTNNYQTEDSESSNLNSHRRCKSQSKNITLIHIDVKRDRSDTSSASVAKKSFERKKAIQHSKQQQYQTSEGGPDDILFHQISDTIQHKSMNDNKFRSMAAGVPTNQNFDEAQLKHIINESNRFLNEFPDQTNHRRQLKNGHSNNSQTQSGQQTQKVRNTSNRLHQQQQTIDDLSKNRFTQSYGGSTGVVVNSIQKKSINNSLNAGSNGGTILIHSRNGNLNSTSQSLEKGAIQRSRNKQQILNQSNTVQSYPLKFDSNLFDKAQNLTVQNQPKIPTNSGTTANFNINHKAAVSATNTAVYINQANMQLIKQQLMAQKKASNLLMKGLSPLKK